MKQRINIFKGLECEEVYDFFSSHQQYQTGTYILENGLCTRVSDFAREILEDYYDGKNEKLKCYIEIETLYELCHCTSRNFYLVYLFRTPSYFDVITISLNENKFFNYY